MICSHLTQHGLRLRPNTETRVTSVLYPSRSITLIKALATFGEPLFWRTGVGIVIFALGIWLVMRAKTRELPEASS